MGIFVQAMMAFSWGALAAYVGMVAFLATQPRVPRFGIFVFTSAVILIPLGCFLYDQDSYRWLDTLTFQDVGTNRGFFAGYFFVNVCFFSGMALSFLSARRLPAPLPGKVRRFCAYAALPSIPWVSASFSPGLFLPIVFVPDAQFLTSRLVFLVFFLLVSIGTYCLLASSAETSRN